MRTLVGRNRRRYGGYIVHAGIAILFLGVAASSAFAHQKDVRLSVRAERRRSATTRSPTARPTAGVVGDRAGTGAPLTFGAVLDVRKGDKHFVLHPSRNFYSTQDPSTAADRRASSTGEATSEVDDALGPAAATVWTAIQPDLSKLNGPIAEAEPEVREPRTRTCRVW